MKLEAQRKYLLLVLSGVIIFSTFEVVTKTMKGLLSGTTLTFYRFLIGGLVLLPFGIKDAKKQKSKLNTKEKGILVVLSFILVAICMTLSQYGIFFADASISALLFSVNPLFVTFFSMIILKEELTLQKISGLILGILGLIVTCLPLLLKSMVDGKYILGVVLVLVSMLLFCIYTVFNKKFIVPKTGAIASTAYTSVIGSLTMIPILLIQMAVNDVNPFRFQVMEILPQFIYCSVIGTGLAYLLYFMGLAKVETGTGSMIFMIKPPLAAIFAAVFLGEQITLNVVIGIILILSGMLVTVKWQPQKKQIFYQRHGEV